MNKRYKIEQDGFSCIVKSMEEFIEEIFPELNPHEHVEVLEERENGWNTIGWLSFHK